MDLTVTWKQINTETPQHGHFSGISVFFQELPEIPHKRKSVKGSVSFKGIEFLPQIMILQ